MEIAKELLNYKLQKAGVPQDSILGPPFFNSHVHDISNIDHYVRFIIYADGTSVFFAENRTIRILESANKFLGKLNACTKATSLQINGGKMKAVHFKARNANTFYTVNIFLGGNKIDIV